LRVIGVSRPARGTTELLPDGRIRYTPARDFFGTDSFEYTLADNDGGLATGEARIVVQPVNDPPAPQADRIVLDEDSTATFEPLSNAIDPDGDPLELVSIGSPAQGALPAEGAGIFRFIPPPAYHGVQSFTYLVRDPSGLTATGEVAILVRPVNDPPTVRDQ